MHLMVCFILYLHFYCRIMTQVWLFQSFKSISNKIGYLMEISKNIYRFTFNHSMFAYNSKAFIHQRACFILHTFLHVHVNESLHVYEITHVFVQMMNGFTNSAIQKFEIDITSHSKFRNRISSYSCRGNYSFLN